MNVARFHQTRNPESGYGDVFVLLPIFLCPPGLLRAIDPGKKLFYLTTPLSASSLGQVNVFVLGNPDELDLKTGSTKPIAVSV